jgi:hypothetical protein
MAIKIKPITASVVALLIFFEFPIFTATDYLNQQRPASFASSATVTQPPTEVEATTRQQIAETYGKLPLTFEANKGRIDSSVQFISRGSGYNLYLTPTEAVLTLRKENRKQKTCLNQVTGYGLVSAIDSNGRLGKEPASAEMTTMRMRLVNGSEKAEVTGLDPQSARVNYFIGNDPQKWQTDVPNYGRVQYKDVYRGVDIVYYGKQRQLEYDFIVSPGADPAQIRLGFDGAQEIRIDETGDLLLITKGGEVRQNKPVVYQEVNGRRNEIASNYLVKANWEVGFEIGSYDLTRPLVIDPAVVYSTYLGGNDPDNGYGISVDSAGNAYVTGWTSSPDFPTLNALQSQHGGPPLDAFVTKLTASGALSYSTYLGGSGPDQGNGIAVDPAGNAYVTGYTSSLNFPTLNAYQPNFSGLADAFVTKLTASGALSYSTYLGDIFVDVGAGIAVDQGGNAYVTGATTRVLNGFGNQDVFVTKLTASGALSYSIKLQADGSDDGFGIAVDPAGNAYVTGLTTSMNFPTLNALQPSHGGGVGDAFVTKLTACGELSYSTYLGGNGFDQGFGIAVDRAGNAYVTGYTQSVNFPTLNAVQTNYQGGDDAFVTKLNSNGPPPVVICEFRARGTGGSNDEFIEIYNTASCAIDVSGWKLKSSNNAAGINTLVIIANGTIIPAGGHFLATNNASNGYSGSVPGDQTYNSDILDNGGVALTQSDDTIADQAGLSAGSAFIEGTALTSLTANDNSSYERKPGGVNGSAQDTNNNAADFQLITPSNPQNLNSAPTPGIIASAPPTLGYSTYLGGAGLDNGYGIAVDRAGNAYVTGWTSSSDFPTLNALQSQHGGLPYFDAFVTKLTASGPLGYSTYLGGSDTDAGQGIAVDGAGSVYVTGQTSSTNFQTANPLQAFLLGQYDSFAVKIFDSSVFSVGAIVSNRGGNNGNVSVSVLGAGFQPGATVKLKAAGQPDIEGANPIVVSSSRISTTFNLRGASPGLRDVVVTLPGGSTATLRDGFTIEEGGSLQLWLNISGRTTIARERDVVYRISFGNSGNVDATDVIVWISVPDGVTAIADAPHLVELGLQPNPPVSRDGYAYTWIYLDKLGGNGYGSIDLHVKGLAVGQIDIRGGILEGTAILQSMLSQSSSLTGVGTKSNLQAVPHTQLEIQSQLEDPPPPSQKGQLVFRLSGSGLRTGHVGIYVGNGIIIDLYPKDILHLAGEYRLTTFDEWKSEGGANYVGSVLPPDVNTSTAAQAGDKAINDYAYWLTLGRPNVPFFAPAVSGLNDCVSFCNNIYRSVGYVPSTPDWWPPAAMFTGLSGKIWPEKSPFLFLGDFTLLIDPLHWGQVQGAQAARSLIQVVASMDPNDKVGPSGYGSLRYQKGDQPYQYVIYFENLSSATAPAQEVVITDQLDPTKFNLSTFSLGPMVFGNHQVEPEPELASFATNLDLRPAENIVVRIAASLNQSTGAIVWRFTSLDPVTGQPPADPLIGFLPPNTNQPQGEGRVAFTVLPKQSLATGTEVRNQASIVFDNNAAIQTPMWSNTLDNSAPSSNVHAFATSPCSTNLNFQWSGTDTGSGIRDYTIYVSDNGGPFAILQSNTKASSATYSGQFGHTYALYSVSRDQTGNIENAPTSPDATVTLNAPTKPPTILLTGQIITLGPPNHQYETVSLAQLVASANDSCGGNLTGNVIIAQVSSDEPEDAQGGGDGDTLNDIVIAPNCKSVQLRAERQGSGNGRVYTITFRVRDAAGNTATITNKVRVPTSQNGNQAVDDWTSYTVLGRCP